MKRLLFLALLIPSLAQAADYILPTDSTSVMIDVFVTNSSTGAPLTGLAYNSASLQCSYHRDTASSDTTITLASSTLGTYTSGAFKEVDATSSKGVYQIGIPNAALASGASNVTINCDGATNMSMQPLRIQLDPYVKIAAGGNDKLAAPFDGTVQSVSGRNVTLQTGTFANNDFANDDVAITFYDASGNLITTVCVLDAVQSTQVVTTQKDVSALISAGNGYRLSPAPACNPFKYPSSR